jgi:hypothetical protein
MKTNEKTTEENAGANVRMDANDMALDALEQVREALGLSGEYIAELEHVFDLPDLVALQTRAVAVLRAHFERKGGEA